MIAKASQRWYPLKVSGAQDMSARAVIKGLLTFVAPPRLYCHSTGGSNSARYCYSVFLRHLIRVHTAVGRAPLGAIAELGPGDTLGIGLAALIAGAERYFAFDARPFSTQAYNVRIFDELVELFRARQPVPTRAEIVEIKPAIQDESFPARILPNEHLERALRPERISALRSALERPGGGNHAPISYVAPWFDAALVREGTIDWIFSQAVMEHVEDLKFVYESCNKWLKPGGVTSHQIDFRSHGTASSWDGHRAYSDRMWRLVRGARPYLINRQPLSEHRKLLGENGLNLVGQDIVTANPTIGRARLADRFTSWSDEDLRSAGAFLVYQKKAA